MLEGSRRGILLCGVAGFLLGTSVAAAQDHPGVEAKNDQAYVVAYRVIRRLESRHIKPSVYCDGKEVAFMYFGRFFTIALSPGKHTISSSNEKKSVSLDAKSGVTYYVKLVPAGKWVLAWFSVVQVDTKTALKELARLRPADTSHVMAPEMVSIGAIPGK